MTDALSPLLVRAARGEPVERPPVWAMRQAGRWDPEFNKLRQGLSFYEFSENVELAARASLLPRRFGVDAIILFYDITSLPVAMRSEEHTSELQSRSDLVCRLLLEKKKNRNPYLTTPQHIQRTRHPRPHSGKTTRYHSTEITSTINSCTRNHPPTKLQPNPLHGRSA